MKIIGFNRVELVVRDDEIDAAVMQFNRLLGMNLPPARGWDGGPVRAAIDFDGHIELVAPVDPQLGMAKQLAEHGPGQVGPLIWEIEDLEAARQWCEENGLRIASVFDSGVGRRALMLDKDQCFGFVIGLMERKGPQGSDPAVQHQPVEPL